MRLHQIFSLEYSQSKIKIKIQHFFLNLKLIFLKIFFAKNLHEKLFLTFKEIVKWIGVFLLREEENQNVENGLLLTSEFLNAIFQKTDSDFPFFFWDIHQTCNQFSGVKLLTDMILQKINSQFFLKLNLKT